MKGKQMKNYLLISLITLLASTNSFGQDTLANPTGNYNYALQFGWSQFTLRSFGNGLIAIRYNQNEFNSFRLAFGLGSKFDSDNKYNDKDTTKTESFIFRLLVQYLHYNQMKNNLAFYWGFGPTYDKRLNITFYNSNNSWAIGISALIGVEWVFLENMSLNAEYGIQASYEKSYSSFNSASNSSNSTSWNSSTYDSFHFGLSVYF